MAADTVDISSQIGRETVRESPKIVRDKYWDC
jgi:hypothetical protein